MARHHATTAKKRKVVKKYQTAKREYKKLYPGTSKVRKMRKVR